MVMASIGGVRPPGGDEDNSVIQGLCGLALSVGAQMVENAIPCSFVANARFIRRQCHGDSQC